MSSVNRLSKVFEQYHNTLSEGLTDSPLLTLFITAGYPEMDSFKDLVLSLDTAGADILEIGMPFSDPLADGPVIQASSQHALDSGVDLDWIFSTIKEIRAFSEIPILLMGYFNPVLSYGIEAFCSSAAASGSTITVGSDASPAGVISTVKAANIRLAPIVRSYN